MASASSEFFIRASLVSATFNCVSTNSEQSVRSLHYLDCVSFRRMQHCEYDIQVASDYALPSPSYMLGHQELKRILKIESNFFRKRHPLMSFPKEIGFDFQDYFDHHTRLHSSIPMDIPGTVDHQQEECTHLVVWQYQWWAVLYWSVWWLVVPCAESSESGKGSAPTT